MPFVTHAVSKTPHGSRWTASSDDVRVNKSTIPWYKRWCPLRISLEVRRRLHSASSQRRRKVNPQTSLHESSTCSSAPDTRSRRFVSPNRGNDAQDKRLARGRTSDIEPVNEEHPILVEKSLHNHGQDKVFSEKPNV